MKRIQNDSGAALVIVLLIAAVVLTLGPLLAAGAISAAKQQKDREAEDRAVDIAEMGVTYAIEEANQYMKDHPLEKEEKLEKYLTEMFRFVQTKMEQVVIDHDHPNRKFHLQDNIYVTPSNTKTKATFRVEGMDGRKIRVIEADIEITGLGKESNQEEDWREVVETIPKKPTTRYTFHTEIVWSKNMTTHYNDHLVLEQGGRMSNNSTVSANNVYSEGDFFIENHTTFIANGFAKLENLSIDNNSLFEVSGNCYGKQLTSLNGNPLVRICGSAVFTDIYMDGALEIGRHLIVKNAVYFRNASVKVKGTAVFQGPLIIDKGSNEMEIGQDLILDVRKGKPSIEGKTIKVGGNLILKEVDRRDVSLFQTLKSEIYVAGDVLVYYKGEHDPEINPAKFGIVPYHMQNKSSSIFYGWSGNLNLDIGQCSNIDLPEEPIDPQIKLVEAKYK